MHAKVVIPKFNLRENLRHANTAYLLPAKATNFNFKSSHNLVKSCMKYRGKDSEFETKCY